MNKIQQFSGGGVLSHLLEHVGDLTHRMSQRYVTEIENAIEYLNPKIKSALMSLRGNNFIREVQDNTRSNYKYFIQHKNETGMFSTIASQYNPKYKTRTARN